MRRSRRIISGGGQRLGQGRHKTVNDLRAATRQNAISSRQTSAPYCRLWVPMWVLAVVGVLPQSRLKFRQYAAEKRSANEADASGRGRGTASGGNTSGRRASPCSTPVLGPGDHSRWPAWRHTSIWCLRAPVLVMTRTAKLAGIAASPRRLNSSNRTHAHSRNTTVALATRSSSETHAYNWCPTVD